MRIPVSAPCLGQVETDHVAEVMRSGWLTLGPMVERFEAEFARRVGVRHAVFTTSGTTALHLALAVLDIGPGHEVLVPDLTYIATANAVTYVGATAVLCDVSADTWCLDVLDAVRRASPRTIADIPVHLYGHPAPSAECLFTIEDAAQGLGGYCIGEKWRPLGTCSTLGVYSFFANKVMTTGEGGMVVTNDGRLNERLRLLRGQGVDPHRRYWHPEVGYNYRPTELQAAIGLAQLSHLDEMLERRQSIVRRYAAALSPVVESPPCARPEAAPWLFTFLVPAPHRRDWLAERLRDTWNIETRPTFVPIHRQPFYSGPRDSDYPNACRIGDNGLSLPTFPDLTDEQVDYVCGAVISELQGHDQ